MLFMESEINLSKIKVENKLYDGDLYIGEWLNSKSEGHGVMKHGNEIYI